MPKIYLRSRLQLTFWHILLLTKEIRIERPISHQPTTPPLILPLSIWNGKPRQKAYTIHTKLKWNQIRISNTHVPSSSFKLYLSSIKNCLSGSRFAFFVESFFPNNGMVMIVCVKCCLFDVERSYRFI